MMGWKPSNECRKGLPGKDTVLSSRPGQMIAKRRISGELAGMRTDSLPRVPFAVIGTTTGILFRRD
jgi:hypothetical protein